MNNESVPSINTIYKGKVISVESLGFKVKLLGFCKKFVGLINSHLLEGSQLQEKIHLDTTVNVKVISVDKDHGFTTISLVDIVSNDDDTLLPRSKADKVDDSRVIRISSPERYQIKQMSSTIENVIIRPIREPHYYLMQQLSLTMGSFGLFSSVTEMPKGFMLSNAIRVKTQPFTDFKEFLRFNGHFHEYWVKGEYMKDNSPARVNPALADSAAQLWNSKKRNAMQMKKQRELLPIYSVREDLIRAVTENRILIVQGETGSGKSTQIPQYLLESGFTKFGKIVCTQPRKLAAMSLAKRVAEEQGVSLGAEVGYKFRFTDRTSSNTLIKYCTEGTLLRECVNSKQLSRYSVIIMDEAHERTTNIDVLFGYLKRQMKNCPNLRIIVSSATMEANKFSKFFNGGAPVFCIQGRTFPVEVFYRTVDLNDYFNAAISTAIYIHNTQKSGDILIFLTGQEEIETAYEVFEDLQAQEKFKDLHVLKIYSALPFIEQVKVFESANEGDRKVILSTNVAETSMTIPGVYYVIDTGYQKLKMYNPKAGLEVLDIMPISQASADQRAGRAGRTGPGQCYRLYTKKSYDTMLKATIPEIQRSNLESVVLQFKAMGIDDVSNFEFLDQPSKEAIFMAEKKLFGLLALDDNGRITNMGKRMVEFPLDPMLSRMLIVSIDLGCSNEIITIIAMLGVQNVFYRPKKKAAVADQKRGEFSSSISDHITLLNAYNLWEKNDFSSEWCYKYYINERSMNEAWDTRNMLLEKMDSARLEVVSAGKNLERIQKALCAGFAQNIVKKNPHGFNYSTIQGDANDLYIHPSSSVMKTNPQWLIYNNKCETKKKYLKDVTVVDPTWLKTLAPSLYSFN